MAKIALADSTISETTASNHIKYEKYEQVGTGGGGNDAYGNPIPPYPIYDWVKYDTSATVKGKAVATVTNVNINGKAPVVMGDRTTEEDTYTLPSGGSYVSGAHTSGQGSVTVGNSRNVFINGKSVAINGSRVTTHAGGSSTINGGLSSTVNIGS